MSLTLVSQRHHFQCAYIYRRNNKLILNAHEYKIEVTVSSPDRISPVIISFEDLKSVISKSVPDNKFLLRNDNSLDLSLIGIFQTFVPSIYQIYSEEITAETLVNAIAHKIEENLSDFGVLLWEVKLRESNDSYVTWNRSSKR